MADAPGNCRLESGRNRGVSGQGLAGAIGREGMNPEVGPLKGNQQLDAELQQEEYPQKLPGTQVLIRVGSEPIAVAGLGYGAPASKKLGRTAKFRANGSES